MIPTVSASPETTVRSSPFARSNAGQGEDIEVNGLQGYTAVVRSANTDFGVVPARYAVIYYNNLAYVFAGASRGQGAVPTGDALFMSTVKTFRRLKENEFALAEPYKIRTIKVGANTHVDDLAKLSPIKKYPADLIRLLNDLYPNKEPATGQLLKIVQ